VVISGHYETKVLPGIHFVGANDGGASAGFLLEMARVLAGRKLKHDVYLVWFDGEESFGVWSERDGIYGSRHLAERWSAEGTLGRIKALINVDMIGDKDLGILKEMNSSAGLQRLVWQAAADLGLGRFFLNLGGAVEDDHVPFLRRGVQAVNLIDFDYGPNNSYWHTEKDTLDKLSAESFQVVGTVLLEVLRRLE
jgi:Zn-dependent M28 family amino/carboxypeptidase